MNYADAGNLDLGVWVLEFLVEAGCLPAALFLTNEDDPLIMRHDLNLRLARRKPAGDRRV